jgi:GTP-binding protein HflX
MLLNKDNETIEVSKEVAVLVGFDDGKDEVDFEYSMNELNELAEAAGVKVVARLDQVNRSIEPRTYIGSGKVEEVEMAVRAYDANLVIFNDELSGSQIRNLEDLIDARIIDRTALILDIFARRAKSKVSKLQVELAQLRYRKPRLIGLNRSLSRAGSGVGARGPGEQKLELDKRRVEERISEISKQLKEASKIRETQRASRIKNETPVVALVGYTNAGKSTVMNTLINMTSEDEEKKVFEKDMLFATLDTSHRAINFSDNKSFVLLDTVGFVSKLPHSLVDAFKATLEEVVEADLLLHVVDLTNSNMGNQIDITTRVLHEIGVTKKQMIYVFNKMDLENESRNIVVEEDYVKISAKMGTNMDTLIEMIKKKVFSDLITANMLIPYTEGSILSNICEKHTVIETEYLEEGTMIKVEIDDKDYNRYIKYVVE